MQFNKYTYIHTYHLCRQGVALASTRRPHSQGPASVGGGIGVGGGNGDGNGDVDGQGDGDGTGAGTGVEAN